MFPVKKLLYFFARFLLIYLVLVAPWPGLRAVCRVSVRTAGRMLLSNFGSIGRVDYSNAPAQRSGEPDLMLGFEEPGGKPVHRKTVNTRHLAYLPLATFLAAALALPGAWRSRMRLLAIGAGPILLYVILRLLLTDLNGFVEAKLLFFDRPYAAAIVWRAEALFVSLPTSWFVLPLLVVGFLGFLLGDFRDIGDESNPDRKKSDAD